MKNERRRRTRVPIGDRGALQESRYEMSHRNRVCLVILAVVWFSMAGGPAAAQTWKDILGAATEEKEPQAEEPQPVDSVDAGFALKEALLISAENAVADASMLDGFLANDDIRIAMPPKLEIARGTLTRFGLSSEVDNLELAMNRAAEGAAADALPLLRDAIRDVPIEDPLATLGAGCRDDRRRSCSGQTNPDRRPAICGQPHLAGRNAGTGFGADRSGDAKSVEKLTLAFQHLPGFTTGRAGHAPTIFFKKRLNARHIVARQIT